MLPAAEGIDAVEGVDAEHMLCVRGGCSVLGSGWLEGALDTSIEARNPPPPTTTPIMFFLVFVCLRRLLAFTPAVLDKFFDYKSGTDYGA